MKKTNIFRSMLLSLMTTGLIMTGFSISNHDTREMVTVCHVKDDMYRWPKTIRVPLSELRSHLAHGDYVGFCKVNPEPGTVERIKLPQD